MNHSTSDSSSPPTTATQNGMIQQFISKFFYSTNTSANSDEEVAVNPPSPRTTKTEEHYSEEPTSTLHPLACTPPSFYNNDGSLVSPLSTADSEDIAYLEPSFNTSPPRNYQPLISGYICKYSTLGVYQKRWFESFGGYLVYYSSHHRNSLLAALRLDLTGGIFIDTHDEESRTFIINLNERKYYLRCALRTECERWVLILNKIRNEKMKQKSRTGIRFRRFQSIP